jgi:hypothetical protein
MVLSQPQFIYMRRLLPLLHHAEREKSDKGGGRRKSILKFRRCSREKHLKYRENTILEIIALCNLLDTCDVHAA